MDLRVCKCAGKQASGIVRGTKKKQEKRLFVYNKLNEEGKFKRARKLKSIIDSVDISKPSLDNIELELDSRFISIDLESNQESIYSCTKKQLTTWPDRQNKVSTSSVWTCTMTTSWTSLLQRQERRGTAYSSCSGSSSTEATVTISKTTKTSFCSCGNVRFRRRKL